MTRAELFRRAGLDPLLDDPRIARDAACGSAGNARLARECGLEEAARGFDEEARAYAARAVELRMKARAAGIPDDLL